MWESFPPLTKKKKLLLIHNVFRKHAEVVFLCSVNGIICILRNFVCAVELMAKNKQSIYIGSESKEAQSKTFHAALSVFLFSVNWIIQLDLHANKITANLASHRLD